MARQAERRQNSRREILCAAMEEFGASGYGGVSIEGICTRHGISKGMMYHYYRGKDELFLDCVRQVFEGLREYVERQAPLPAPEDALTALFEYFMLREDFCEGKPDAKRVFEQAVFSPTKALERQISELRAPLREANRRFFRQVLSCAALRPGVTPGRAARYLESLDEVFWPMIVCYRQPGSGQDLEAALAATGELLDMALFGIAGGQPSGPEGAGERRPPAGRERP